MSKEEIREMLKSSIEEYGLSDVLAAEYFNFELEMDDSKEISHVWETVVNDLSVQTRTKITLAKRYREYLMLSGDLKLYDKIQYFILVERLPFGQGQSVEEQDTAGLKRKREEE